MDPVDMAFEMPTVDEGELQSVANERAMKGQEAREITKKGGIFLSS